MPEFIVQTVREGNQPDRHGNRVFWADLMGPQGEFVEGAYIARRPDRSPVAVGEALQGEVTTTDRGPWFRAQAQQASPASGDGERPEHRIKENPETVARIVRMAAQKNAIAYMQAKAQAGQLPANFDPAQLKHLVEWFVRDATKEPQPETTADPGVPTVADAGVPFA